MEWILELALVALLAATLFHAVRLERALGVLKRDRANVVAAKQAGVSNYIVKSFNAETLRDKIEKVLGHG